MSRPERRYQKVSIASGQPASVPIDLQSGTLAGVIFPDVDLTNTSLKVQVATELAGPFVDLKDGRGASAADLTVTVYRNKAVPIDNLALLAGWQYLRLAGASNEAANRDLTFAIRPV
jgi:hypothetical protein